LALTAISLPRDPVWALKETIVAGDVAPSAKAGAIERRDLQ
jgi:hypothetical protein